MLKNVGNVPKHYGMLDHQGFNTGIKMSKFEALKSFNTQLSPKGSEWRLIYEHKPNNIYVEYIFNNTGLTAFEAWRESHIPHNPPFHLVECFQLKPF